MDNMFEGLLGKAYKVDAYLERLEKLLKIKKLANEVGEPEIAKAYTEALKICLEQMTKELTDKPAKKEASNE